MNKKAIVSGASRGIGKGIALALAREGYDVAISYVSQPDAAQAVAEEIRALGQACFCFESHLEQPGACSRFFRDAVAALGGLDVLVNNAGQTVFQALYDLTDEQLDHLLQLDFRTNLIMMRDAARYMMDHGIRGSIINVTSSRGERAYPECGVYCGLKAGLNHAVECFALDVAEYGIRINNVAPGATRVRSKTEIAAIKQGGEGDYYWREEYKTQPIVSDFWDELSSSIPLMRAGTPEDIGNAVAFLVSDRASYITGITLRVDGGLILPGMPEGQTGTGARNGGWGRPSPRR